MIVVNINNKSYHLKNDITDLILLEVVAIDSIEIPVKLRNIIEATNEDKREQAIKQLSESDVFVDFIQYYKQVIYIASNIPQSIIDTLDIDTLTQLFNRYLSQLVGGIINFYPSDYEIKNIAKFKHKGVEYYLPKSLTIGNNTTPLAKETVIVFSEAFDLFNNKWQMYNLFMAVLCRPQDKEYNESDVLDLSDDFKDLPMSVCLEVFFCFIKRLNTLAKRLDGSLKRHRLQVNRKVLLIDQDLMALDSKQTFTRLRNRTYAERIAQLN